VRGVGSLPVVDGDEGRLLGMLGRAEVLAAYQGTVAKDEREADPQADA
jgi:CBS domain-containing protein